MAEKCPVWSELGEFYKARVMTTPRQDKRWQERFALQTRISGRRGMPSRQAWLFLILAAVGLHSWEAQHQPCGLANVFSLPQPLLLTPLAADAVRQATNPAF